MMNDIPIYKFISMSIILIFFRSCWMRPGCGKDDELSVSVIAMI